MRTKWKRAGQLDTRDELVKDEHTVALCEITSNGRTVNVRHAGTPGKNASKHARPSTGRETFDVRDKIRVLS